MYSRVIITSMVLLALVFEIATGALSQGRRRVARLGPVGRGARASDRGVLRRRGAAQWCEACAVVEFRKPGSGEETSGSFCLRWLDDCAGLPSV
jgi:hypothetical protein